jgi:site-specific DNA-methyltransferase (adenine-specific)
LTPHYSDHSVTLYHGDCLDVLRGLPDQSVDAVVTDPPYGIGFMGKEWDGPAIAAAAKRDRETRKSLGPESASRPGRAAPRSSSAFGDAAIIAGPVRGGREFQDWCELWATECLRVLKPGGHMLAFGGTRTYHRLTCAVEDAGFEIRDSIAWLYGSGFPKSLDVSKAIDKKLCIEAGTHTDEPDHRCGREVVGLGINHAAKARHAATHSGVGDTYIAAPDGPLLTAPATDAARQWQGWGTAMKPAFEPIVVARKPLIGTVAGNVQAWGTGALNVDACRIEHVIVNGGNLADNPHLRKNAKRGTSSDPSAYGSGMKGGLWESAPAGRWPANVILDEHQAAALDQQSDVTGFGDSGGASRFMYTAKADAGERIRVDGTAHPTVKPLTLMRWLVRLVCPPGGTVLEPFAGSGTTVEACILEGFHCIAIEREPDYLPLIVQRVNRQRDPIAYTATAGEDLGLFGLDGEIA